MFDLKKIQEFIYGKFQEINFFEKCESLSFEEFDNDVITIIDSLFDDEEYIKLRYESSILYFYDFLVCKEIPLEFRIVFLKSYRIEPLLLLSQFLVTKNFKNEIISLFENSCKNRLSEMTDDKDFDIREITRKHEVSEKRLAHLFDVHAKLQKTNPKPYISIQELIDSDPYNGD